ncbi:hypothetical protein REPUB_Repub12eG0024300 [Reevesia pubescens]
MLEDYKKASLVIKAAIGGVETFSLQWTPSRMRVAKVNFDAAIFKDLGGIGVGVAIRDLVGEALALLCSKIQVLTEPFVAKCLALKESLYFALDIEINENKVERDSTLTICAVKRQFTRSFHNRWNS